MHDLVAALRRALDGLERGHPVAQALDLGVDRRRRPPGLAPADLQALVVPSVAVRAHADLDREGQRLALAGTSSAKSMSGSPIGAIPAVSMASTYHSLSDERSASSKTASRPRRRMTTGGGTLPLRKPGMRSWPPSLRAACWTLRSTSSAGTSASTRTRDSGSSVTLVFRVDMVAQTIAWQPCLDGLQRAPSPGPAAFLLGGVIDVLAYAAASARGEWGRVRGAAAADARDWPGRSR